jgi:hypothetical protein
VVDQVADQIRMGAQLPLVTDAVLVADSSKTPATTQE